MQNPIASLSVVEALVGRKTAAVAVADSLRSAIQSGALQDGAELNQVALAEHFGVSRVPIREAMSSLAAEGWISALPHRRAIVQGVSPARLAETFEIRALLEAHLLEKAMRGLSDAAIKRLMTFAKRMDRITDHGEWVAANRAWHQMLLEPSGAKMTLELVLQLTSQAERYLNLRGENVERTAEAGHEHADILRAVAAKDVKLAQRMLTAHIDHTYRLVLAALSTAPPSAS